MKYKKPQLVIEAQQNCINELYKIIDGLKNEIRLLKIKNGLLTDEELKALFPDFTK